MRYEEIYIESWENNTSAPAFPVPVIKANPGVRIITSRFLGPAYMNRNTQVGPDATVGKYFGMNESCFIARSTIGAFCAIGARTAINPFNHPSDWLSIHEFQYHAMSFDWVPEYNEIERLHRTPDMFKPVTIGSDVWMGHNVNVMPGVTIGHGAVICAGAILTKDVPDYATVTGVPAKVQRLRFSESVVDRLLKVRWWEFDLSELSGLPYRDVERCLPILEDMRAQHDAGVA